MISVRGQRVGLNSYDPAVVEVLKQKRAQVSAAREVRCSKPLVCRAGRRSHARERGGSGSRARLQAEPSQIVDETLMDRAGRKRNANDFKGNCASSTLTLSFGFFTVTGPKSFARWPLCVGCHDIRGA